MCVEWYMIWLVLYSLFFDQVFTRYSRKSQYSFGIYLHLTSRLNTSIQKHSIACVHSQILHPPTRQRRGEKTPGQSTLKLIIIVLLLRHTADAGANHTRQLLLAHGPEQPNSPTNEEDHEDGEAGQQPEGHDDVLLLACGATPLRRLLGAVLVGAHVGCAHARVARSAVVGGVLVGVPERAGAVAGAVPRHALAGGQGREAVGQDALQRRRVIGVGVEGCVGLGLAGDGRVGVVAQQGRFLLALGVLARHRVAAVRVLAGLLLGHGEGEYGVILTNQSLDCGDEVLYDVSCGGGRIC